MLLCETILSSLQKMSSISWRFLMALEQPYYGAYLGLRNVGSLLWIWQLGGSLCRYSRPAMAPLEARGFM